MVVWMDEARDGSGAGVFARRFAADGVPIGDDFQVNSYTTGVQGFPAVASDAEGDFVVVWTSADGSDVGIFARRFTAMGPDPEFRVNEITAGTQTSPDVSSDADGDVVVVWNSFPQDGSGAGVYARRMDADGIVLGSEFRVNTYTLGNQGSPAVASTANGDFVVVWQSDDQDGDGYGIFGQRFNPSGTARGSEFRANSYTTSNQRAPAVAASGGSFVVVWQSDFQDGSVLGVFRRSFSFLGLALGAEFRVNVVTTGDQGLPSVARDPDGRFVVTWTSFGQDGNAYGVVGRWFGAGDGGEFLVNRYTTDSQLASAVSSGRSGSFVVTWQSTGQDGSSGGIFAQRYADFIFGDGFQTIVGP